jgi:hypothetical protein
MFRLAILIVACVAALPALQMQERTLVSPLTGQSFSVTCIPVEASLKAMPADMGTDVDGCRHTTGVSEYDYQVAVDPYSYFAALVAEWEPRGQRLATELSDEEKAWVRDQYQGEREIDRNHTFQTTVQINRQTGKAPPDRATFVIPQQMIPVEKRYRLALACYERRGARHSVLAKIALSGAWALRVRGNVPLLDQRLAGGTTEVNDRLRAHIVDGEVFDPQKWLQVYRGIVEADGLSREGYAVAGLAYFGLLLRDGDSEAARMHLQAMGKRLGGDEVVPGDILRGLVRERRKLFDDHQRMLQTAADRFVLSLRAEEVVRQHIPEIMLVTAECLRRTNQLARAGDWYLALGKLPETQPSMRADLRTQGRLRSLPPDKPYLVQLGWIADEQLERLASGGNPATGQVSGPDRALLNAILNEGLGTAAYNAPTWRPATGAEQRDCASILDQVGKAVLDAAFRTGAWPATLGELWEKEILRDRNRVNRFCCPVTGKPLLYSVPPGDLSSLAPSTVIVATAEAIPTGDGPRFGGLMLNAKLVWSKDPLAPGKPAP